MAKKNIKKTTELNGPQKIKKGLALQKSGELAFIRDSTRKDVTNDPRYQEVMKEHIPVRETLVTASQKEVDENYMELTTKIKALETMNSYTSKIYNYSLDKLQNKLNSLTVKFYTFVGVTVIVSIIVNLYNWFN